MVMKYTITKFKPKSGLESKFNPLFEWMPESARLKLASVWCYFKYLAISAEFNFSDAD